MKLIVVILACCLATFKTNAQSTPGKSSELNENTIVKDSTGKTLAYDYWHQRVLSGQYTINRTYTGRDTSDFILTWLTPVHRKRLDSLRAKFLAEHTPVNQAGTQQAIPPVINNSVPKRLPQQSDGFKNGEEMEPFKERDINGQKIDTKALKGKIVVLNFWFINCPACRVEIPELNEVAASYSSSPDIVFIGLCLDQRWEIKDFLKKTPFNFQHIANARYYGDKYQVNLYPTTVVLDKQGIVRFNSVGADNTGYWIKKTIEDIKAEKL